MLVGVGLTGMRGVLRGVLFMSRCRMGVVGRFFVVASRMVLGGFAVMLSGFAVVFGGFFVVVGSFGRHGWEMK